MVEASSSLTKLLVTQQVLCQGQSLFQIGSSYFSYTGEFVRCSWFNIVCVPVGIVFWGILITENMLLKNKTTAYSLYFSLVISMVLTLLNVLRCVYALPSAIMTTVLLLLVGMYSCAMSKSGGKARTAIKGHIFGFQINEVAGMLCPLLPLIITEYFTMLKPNAKLLSMITTLHSVLSASMLLYQYNLSSSGVYAQEIDAIAEELTAESENSKSADSENANKSEQLSESEQIGRMKDNWRTSELYVFCFVGWAIIPLIKIVMVARSSF